MTPHEFEQFAQERMEEYLGVSLKKKAPNGFPKIFDLVSDDESVVGDAKYLTLVAGKYDPPAKLMEITGHVWLLEKVQARRRFLVFGNQVEVAEIWLRKYGRLPTTVEFYFLDSRGQVTDLRQVPPASTSARRSFPSSAKPSAGHVADETQRAPPAAERAKYYLYVNHANDRARVHREGCTFVHLHGGTHRYDEGHWEEFPSRDAAFAALERTGKTERAACTRCRP